MIPESDKPEVEKQDDSPQEQDVAVVKNKQEEIEKAKARSRVQDEQDR